jgi:hypothetical protein
MIIIIIAASIYIVRSCYRLGILSYVSTMSYGDDLYSIALGIDSIIRYFFNWAEVRNMLCIILVFVTPSLSSLLLFAVSRI